MVTIDGEGVDWTGHTEDEREDYALMAFNSNNSGSDTEKLLAEAEKEKEELKAKLENFQSSSKGLSKLLNSQMTAKDKSRLGYGSQIHNGVLSYENEVFASVFDNRSSDVEDSLVDDRFAKVKGMHASSEKTLETVPKPVESKLKVVNEPKVWSDAPIIEEYESDSNDEYVSKASVEQEKPSCAFINTVKHVKTPSFSHLIRDCDFHEKRMAKQVELNKQKGKSTGPREHKPVWNIVQRLNHQNKFVPTAVLTKIGRFPVNADRQNFPSQAASTSTARKVNTTRLKVNEIRPRHNVYKSHSPIRRPFNKTTAQKANFAHHKVKTARDKSVSVVGGKWESAVKASAGCNWRYKRHYWNRDNPHQTLKGKGIVDSRCSRHMIWNKASLVDYQDFNGGPVAFGGSKGQITDTECLVLSPEFQLLDENQVLLRVPRQHNMYSFNLKNIVPSG
nr:hypothetical protein [Tanacetum cinerariifolium]